MQTGWRLFVACLDEAMMKILYIHPGLSAKDGSGIQGSEFVAAFQSLARENDGIKLLVHQNKKGATLSAQLRRVYKRVKKLLPSKWKLFYRGLRRGDGDGFTRTTGREALSLQLEKEIASGEKPDVIYARVGHKNLELINCMANWDIPLILQVNAALFHELPLSGYGVLTEKERALERTNWDLADAIIVLSNGLKAILVSQGVDERKVFVNPLGADIEKFNPAISGKVIRKKYNLSDKKVIGYVGKLSRVHDLKTLIDAFGLATKKSAANIHLLLIGEGSERENCSRWIVEQGLQEKVILTGFVRPEAIPEYMAAMDICTAPRLVEDLVYSSPIKMFEYMAMAKPIIATRGGQVEEVLDDGKSGLLVEPHSAERFAEALLKLINDPQLCISLGQEARQAIVSKNLTWRRNAEEVAKICRNVLQPAAK